MNKDKKLDLRTIFHCIFILFLCISFIPSHTISFLSSFSIEQRRVLKEERYNSLWNYSNSIYLMKVEIDKIYNEKHIEKNNIETLKLYEEYLEKSSMYLAHVVNFKYNGLSLVKKTLSSIGRDTLSFEENKIHIDKFLEFYNDFKKVNYSYEDISKAEFNKVLNEFLEISLKYFGQ